MIKPTTANGHKELLYLSSNDRAHTQEHILGLNFKSFDCCCKHLEEEVYGTKFISAKNDSFILQIAGL